MKLTVKPYHQNTYPVEGLLVRGADIFHWLEQLQLLGISLEQTAVYAIPGTSANSIWGCFAAISPAHLKNKQLYAAQLCQLVHGLLYIPFCSRLYPAIGSAELQKLLKEPHIFHPDFGWVALETKIVWEDILALPAKATLQFRKPADALFIPSVIQSLEIRALPPEETLANMEANVVPSKKKFEDKPLNPLEKVKMFLLKRLLSDKKQTGRNNPLAAMLDKLLSKPGDAGGSWSDKMEQDLEQLEKRSQSEMQKLLELFKNDPQEALKYAIPLDEDGTSRGGLQSYRMGRLWDNFTLFGNRPPGSGGPSAYLGGEAYNTLHNQYMQTAAKLVEQNEHEKAAFVYMKLLKNNFLAAQTLENGKLYPQAASLYLSHLNNKEKAAACYEKGKMTTEAIELYKELKQYEKVGDRYMGQQKTNDALAFYQHAVDEKVSAGRYVTASLIYREKMNATGAAQELLLKGWRTNRDAVNCINNYFQNIDDHSLLGKQIQHIYRNEVTEEQMNAFIMALKYEYKKGDEVAALSKEIAYEIVAGLAAKQPDIVSELRNFNNDPGLVKDVLRYKASRRR